ncbi:MAG: hypothetical protein ACI8Q9_002602 [Planctomycetota bacterium]|jgi:hypothetical protein
MKLLLPTLLLLPALATAQTPHLSQTGGSTTSTTTWSIEAAPNQVYGVLLALTETPSEPFPGVFLDIPLTLLPLTFNLPGFLGTTSPTGTAAAAFTLAEPALAGLTISAQALTGPNFDAPSNLIRVTLANEGTFAPTLGNPILPIVGGAAAPDANGDLIFAGGSGPLAQRYLADLEEFEDAGVTFGTGLLAQATGLNDGRILFTGGFDTAGTPTADSAVYDPNTELTTTLAMGEKRAGHQATLMSDGRVMITGGFANISVDLQAIIADPLQIISVFQGLLNSTEFFDPTTDTFAAGPNMLEPRALHTATAMNNGKILVAGGMSLLPIVNLPNISGTAYAYDPNIGSFGFPSFFSGARLLHSAILQADGSVLMAGGLAVDLSGFLTSGDPLDITVGSLDDIQRYTTTFFGGSFSSVGTLSESRAAAGMGRTSKGGVLIAGGLHVTLGANLTTLDFGLTATSEVYTQGSGVTSTGSMANPRVFPVLVPLADGTTMIVGGGPVEAEIFQP